MFVTAVVWVWRAMLLVGLFVFVLLLWFCCLEFCCCFAVGAVCGYYLLFCVVVLAVVGI